MAAYAALVSLLNIMEQIQNHPRHSFSFNEKQIESLSEKFGFLLDFVESYDHHGGIGKEELEDLESQIASAAHAAEDIIESHVVNQIHAGSTLSGNRSSCFWLDLQIVIDDVDSIKKMIVKVKARRGCRDQQPTYSKPATSSSRPLTTGKNAMVGFEDELIQLMERLTVPKPNRQIIPIVGMGGIGKTTLARNVYEHLLIVHHFDVRHWATVSQEYSAKEIISQLLFGQAKSTGETIDELGERLHKNLSGKRYLIVLDDMWSIGAWDEIRMFFPDNGNRSRIVITTRISNMAIDFSSSSFLMNFLDENKSWKLFCENAFGEECCPPELEGVGQKIVKNCKGLPLSIVVIGGHLGKSSRMKEYWENVANNINSILNSGDDEQCLNILSLSYSHLPVYLKPCFLYMGIFPEDEEISVRKLIRLWVAEGFLKPNYKAQVLEDVAEGYLKDLVERNLILVRTWSRSGKIKTCSIHDLLRELCLKLAKKEKFFSVLDTPPAIDREHRIVIHESIPEEKHHTEVFDALKSARLVRSLKCKGGELLFDFKLLRVLDGVQGLMDDVYECYIEAYFQKVNLRYLNYFYHLKYIFPGPLPYPSLYLPSSISLLWNLQTLIIIGECELIAPSEIWEMPQLRHIQIVSICLPDPLSSDGLGQQDDFVLRNLQTLLTVSNFRLSEEVCKRIPNVRELQILYLDFPSGCEASTYYYPHNLVRFHKLESLSLYFSEEPHWRDFVLSLTFPSSLQELSLRNCFLRWEDLTVIGSLPHLEVLILLGANPVIGAEWNPVDGEFPRLKSLEIYACDDLICWNANSSHFPALESLVLAGMPALDEIPLGIGEIPTLRSILLDCCKVSATMSAMRILAEQESLGNDGLRLVVRFLDKKEEESFKETVQEEGLETNNLRLDPSYRSDQEDDYGCEIYLQELGL